MSTSGSPGSASPANKGRKGNKVNARLAAFEAAAKAENPSPVKRPTPQSRNNSHQQQNSVSSFMSLSSEEEAEIIDVRMKPVNPSSSPKLPENVDVNSEEVPPMEIPQRSVGRIVEPESAEMVEAKFQRLEMAKPEVYENSQLSDEGMDTESLPSKTHNFFPNHEPKSPELPKPKVFSNDDFDLGDISSVDREGSSEPLEEERKESMEPLETTKSKDSDYSVYTNAGEPQQEVQQESEEEPQESQELQEPQEEPKEPQEEPQEEKESQEHLDVNEETQDKGLQANSEPDATSKPEATETEEPFNPQFTNSKSKHIVQPSIDSFQTTHEGSESEDFEEPHNTEFDHTGIHHNFAAKSTENTMGSPMESPRDSPEVDVETKDVSMDDSLDFRDTVSVEPTSPKLPERHHAPEITSPKLPPRHGHTPSYSMTSPKLPPRHTRTNSQISETNITSHPEEIKSPELPPRRDPHQKHKQQNSSQYDLPEMPRPISFPSLDEEESDYEAPAPPALPRRPSFPEHELSPAAEFGVGLNLSRDSSANYGNLTPIQRPDSEGYFRDRDLTPTANSQGFEKYKYIQSPIIPSNPKDAEEPPILGVCVVGFHHQRGPEVEYWVGGDGDQSDMWPYLPFQSLPDGSHQFEENICYFTLLYDRQSKSKVTSMTFVRDEDGNIKEGTSDFRDVTTLFAIACSRQVSTDSLEIKDEDYTRSVVQKSVVVISRKPIFGPIKEKLMVVTRSYFEQRNFEDREIVDHFYESLLQMPLWTNESDIQVGMNLQRCIKDFGAQTLTILKAMLLEQKVLFYATDTDVLGTTQFALISLVPDLINYLQDSGSPLLSNYETNLRPNAFVDLNDPKSVLRYIGFPLQLFAAGGVLAPFVPLQQFDDLKKPETRYGVIGTTNNLFLTEDINFDLVVHIDTQKLEFRNPKLAQQVKLTNQDKAFMKQVVDNVSSAAKDEQIWQPESLGYIGGEDYIRHEFESYLTALMSTSKKPDADYSAFNQQFFQQWKLTNNFRIFDKNTDPSISTLFIPEHPGSKLSKPSGLDKIWGLFKHEEPAATATSTDGSGPGTPKLNTGLLSPIHTRTPKSIISRSRSSSLRSNHSGPAPESPANKLANLFRR